MRPLCLMTSVRKTLKKRLPKNARKNRSLPKRLVGQPCRLTDLKNLKKTADLTTRVNLVQNLLTTKEISASVGTKLLDINRTSIYYKGTPVSEDELACKEIINHLHWVPKNGKTDNRWLKKEIVLQLDKFMVGMYTENKIG